MQPSVHANSKGARPERAQDVAAPLAKEQPETFFLDVDVAAALPPEIEARAAARATLGVLAERITPSTMRDVLDALPSALREVFADQPLGLDDPPPQAPPRFAHAEFVRRVASRLGIDALAASSMVPGIFRALRARLSVREVADVASQLSDELERDWLSVEPGHVLPSGLVPTPPSVHLLVRQIELEGTLPGDRSAVQALDAVLRGLAPSLAEEKLKALASALPGAVSLMLIDPEVRSADASVGRSSMVLTVGGVLHLEEEQAREVVRRVLAAAKVVLPGHVIDMLTDDLDDEALSLLAIASA